MTDPGIRAAEKGQIAIERRIRRIYRKARDEIQQEIQKYNLRFMRNDAEMRAKVAEQVITEAEYQQWLKFTVFRGKEWDAKVQHCTDIITSANRAAMQVIRGEQLGVMAENMSFQAYLLETGVNADLGFTVYSSETVNNLLKNQPELLPRKVVNGAKDKAWNKNKIANEITKCIIKGDGIGNVADSLADVLALQNDAAMKRYARTAMTSAQNAGRMEMMHEAEDEGVNVRKKWIATLDSRTRDAHADLDGETAAVDEAFHTADYGDIMYPGDPAAEPGNVYNCRCTLGYVIDGYTGNGQRRAYDEWTDADGQRHRESYIIEDMSYNEWKEWKEHNGPQR